MGMPAGNASILAMSAIAFAVFCARLFLKETLTLLEIAGALAVVGGLTLLLATKARKCRPIVLKWISFWSDLWSDLPLEAVLL
jgi:hypothetical protein